VWKYDDVNCIQKLVGFETVCFLCHNIKHLVLAGMLIGKGAVDYKELIKHYCVVNDCTEQDFHGDSFDSLALWEERSKHEWKIDFSYLGGVKERVEGARAWMKEHPKEVKDIKQKL